MIRARVPSSEVDDLVQATLTDALDSNSVPLDTAELKKWVFGIARHKIVDFYRRARRESPGLLPEIQAPGAPHSEKDMVRWAEKELAENQQGDETLDWMLREGDGEKLENIADEDKVPAPRVRQRVSRWRKHLRERWAAELAAVAAIAVILGGLWWAWRHRPQDGVTVVTPDNSSVVPVDSAMLRAAELRAVALQRCDKGEWVACLQGLDEAAKLDPAGDSSDAVKQARQGAADAMRAPESPTPSPSSVPSSNAPPAPAPEKLKAPPPAPNKTDSFNNSDKDTKLPMKGPVTNESNKKDSKKTEPNYNVAPAPTETPPPVPQQTATPQPQQPPSYQQQAPSKDENPTMQQKAPKKTKGGKPTTRSKESSDWESGK